LPRQAPPRPGATLASAPRGRARAGYRALRRAGAAARPPARPTSIS
jgi:hypothetical protein